MAATMKHSNGKPASDEGEYFDNRKVGERRTSDAAEKLVRTTRHKPPVDNTRPECSNK
jgi:hypothetical protein